MKARDTKTIRHWLKGPLALQGFVATGVLLMALSPVDGGTALYLPIGARSAAGTIAWARAQGAALLAPGPYRGAFFLRLPGHNVSGAALRSGALLFAVPEFLCGTPPKNKMAQRS